MIRLLFWPIHLFKAFRQSIAYLPSLLALAYALLAYASLFLPISDEQLPSLLVRLIEPPEDTRSLLAALLGGMISLMVFSFSMVMSVLSQAGGQFSHKLVFGLISERHHQRVLGHYLGTILFALVLLMTPGATEDIATWRTLAVYLACLMVIHCLALFVYFIHNASQSIQVDAVAADLHQSTLASMQALQTCQSGEGWRVLSTCLPPITSHHPHHPVHARQAGYLQNADLTTLATLAKRAEGTVHLHFHFGDYVVAGMPILSLEASEAPDSGWYDEVRATLTYMEGESISEHYVFGMTQLMEVALKALSPGINDPGTARLCLHRLTDLLRRRLEWRPCDALFDRDGACRVTWRVEEFDSLAFRLFQPILTYGREDLSIALELLQSLKTLSQFADNRDIKTLQAHADRVVEMLAQAASHPLDRRFVSDHLNRGTHRLSLPDSLPRLPS